MSAATYLLGDVVEVMATMPDNSVDLVLTSPPFLALRSYLPAGHNRDCTLIALDERNIDLARQRVGMFLNTTEPEKAA